MANKTIYIKDEKIDLYDKAVQYSGEKSLSSLLENVVEKIVKENEENLRDAIMMVAAERSGITAHIDIVIDYAKRAISKEIWDRAEHILDIFEEKEFFKDGMWMGTEGKPETGSNYFWMETMVEDEDNSLDEMYRLATSPRFKEIEGEVKKKEELMGRLIRVIVKEWPDLIIKKAKGLDKVKFLKDLSEKDNDLLKVMYIMDIAKKYNVYGDLSNDELPELKEAHKDGE